MTAKVEIEAGVCGFRTRATARSDDGQNVTLEVTSDCEKIQKVAASLNQAPLDAYREISAGGKGKLLGCAAETLKGCCAACAVPVGLFKSMQVAAGLALPRDISIRLSKE